MMRIECFAFVLSILSLTGIRVLSSASAQENSLGVVLVAGGAHVGQSAATPGSSIYAGEALHTDAGGTLEIGVQRLRFGLRENSYAAFYPRGRGSVAQLTRGTLTFHRESGESDLEILASDVRILPQTDGLVTGEVSIVVLQNHCDQPLRPGTSHFRERDADYKRATIVFGDTGSFSL